MKISELFRLIFKKYEEDDVSVYIHSGVGYTGIDYDLFNGQRAKIKHSGVGYTGVYDE